MIFHKGILISNRSIPDIFFSIFTISASIIKSLHTIWSDSLFARQAQNRSASTACLGKSFGIWLTYTSSVFSFHASLLNLSLREKCPNKEFFLVCVLPHSDWIQTRKNSAFEHFSRSVLCNYSTKRMSPFNYSKCCIEQLTQIFSQLIKYNLYKTSTTIPVFDSKYSRNCFCHCSVSLQET